MFSLVLSSSAFPSPSLPHFLCLCLFLSSSSTVILPFRAPPGPTYRRLP